MWKQQQHTEFIHILSPHEAKQSQAGMPRRAGRQARQGSGLRAPTISGWLIWRSCGRRRQIKTHLESRMSGRLEANAISDEGKERRETVVHGRGLPPFLHPFSKILAFIPSFPLRPTLHPMMAKNEL